MAENKKSNCAILISCIAAAIAAVAACVSVWQTSITSKEQITSRRPYIVIKNSTITKEDQIYKLRSYIENIGINPATLLKINISLFSWPIKKPPYHTNSYALGGDLESNRVSKLNREIKVNRPSLPKGYIVLTLKYEDAYHKKQYIQDYYLSLETLNRPSQFVDLYHVTDVDKRKITDCLNK